MNESILFGRFVKKPELRKTPTERSVTSFTLAVDRDYRKGNETVTDFIDCVAWNATAENICKYFDRGNRIIVKGSLASRLAKYIHKETGVEISYTKTEVNVDKFDFVERKQDSGNASQGNAGNAQQNDNYAPAPVPMPPQTEYASDMDITDDDYPF